MQDNNLEAQDYPFDAVVNRDQVAKVMDALMTDLGTGVNYVDFHKMIASKIFGIKVEEVTKEQRQLSKRAFFSYLTGTKDAGVDYENVKDEFNKQFRNLNQIINN